MYVSDDNPNSPLGMNSKVRRKLVILVCSLCLLNLRLIICFPVISILFFKTQFFRASETLINKGGYDIDRNDPEGDLRFRKRNLLETVPYMYREYTTYAYYRKEDQKAGKFFLEVTLVIESHLLLIM